VTRDEELGRGRERVEERTDAQHDHDDLRDLAGDRVWLRDRADRAAVSTVSRSPNQTLRSSLREKADRSQHEQRRDREAEVASPGAA